MKKESHVLQCAGATDSVTGSVRSLHRQARVFGTVFRSALNKILLVLECQFLL